MARLVLRMAALATVFLIAICALPSSALMPPEATIKWVTYGGTGCGFDDTESVYSNDYKTVTFILRGMSTTIKGGSGNERKQKFCSISLGLSYPDGWSFTVRQSTGRAFVDIARGSKVAIKSDYYFSGLRGTPIAERVHHGPLRSTIRIKNIFKQKIWSVCNTTPNVNIKTTVRVEGLKAAISDVRVLFDFDWRTC